MIRSLFCFAGLLFCIPNVGRADGTIELRGLFSDACGAFWGRRYNFGVFVIGTNGSETLVLPLGTSDGTSFSINAPSPFVIPGTSEGQVVSLAVRGWSAPYGTNWMAAFAGPFASTSILGISLGPSNGPGTRIWQSLSGTFTNRFWPLDFCGLAGPKFFVSGKTVAEGSNGVVDVTCSVLLNGAGDPPTNFPKVVSFSTRSLTAMAGSDFIPTNGTLEFQKGEFSKSVTIRLTQDAEAEADEQFTLELFDPRYASTVFSSRATITITEGRIIDTRLEGNDALVTFQTVVGRQYAVDYSTELSSWTAVVAATNIVGVGGPMTIRDAGGGQGKERFYRLRVL